MMRSERTVMLLAGAMLSESDLDETEAVYQAIIERGLVDDYIKINDWIIDLPEDADEAQKSAVIDRVIGVIDRVMDCFDTSNWEADPTEEELRAEAIFKQYQEQALTPAQKDVCDRVIDMIQKRVTGKSMRSE